MFLWLCIDDDNTVKDAVCEIDRYSVGNAVQIQNIGVSCFHTGCQIEETPKERAQLTIESEEYYTL